MSRTDAIVLGAGIVGTSIALHLAKRGLSVTLVDKAGPGEATSYGNTGVIVGSNVFPTGFPRSIAKLFQVAMKRAPEANYHLRGLLGIAPWLASYYRFSSLAKLEESGALLHPLMSRSVSEHKALLEESGAMRYLRENGWITLYRTGAGFAAARPLLDFAARMGRGPDELDTAEAVALEPGLRPVFRHALLWPDVCSLSNPLQVTRAYADRFTALGGRFVNGDARTLRRDGGQWQVDTAEGPAEAGVAVVALGPWSSDVLAPLGIRVPLGIKRGYHRHYAAAEGATLSRPIIDAEYGYALTPMEQGLRLTTGAEFAGRDALPTPVQFDRLLPHARALFPIGAAKDDVTWLGRRPNMPDSLPVIGPAPRQPGLWLGFGHGHWGLTLGPVTGRLLADMITGVTPFTDPAPFRAERFA
jgi:D-amino-acid dehydrogenase